MKLPDELKNAIIQEDFYTTNNILEKISEEKEGLKYVEPLISIMESNPETDFGIPGPVVHFIEKFPEEAYVDVVLASLKRMPTSHVLWMLNRIINNPESKRRMEYIQVLSEISERNDADAITRAQAKEYYEYHMNILKK